MQPRLLLCLLCCLASAAFAVAADEFDTNETLRYQDIALGGGPRPVLEQITLPAGRAKEEVARSIIRALQTFDLALEGGVSGDKPPLSDGRWATDVVPLAAKEVRSYNDEHGHARLPADHIIGIKYVGIFTVKPGLIDLSIKTLVYYRGSASSFREYPRENYNAGYFSRRLMREIEKQLQEIGKLR